MSHNLTEVSEFTANVPVPDPGDERKAVSIVPAFQALANRTTLHNGFYQVMVGTGGAQTFTVSGLWNGTQRYLNTVILEGFVESYGGIGVAGNLTVTGGTFESLGTTRIGVDTLTTCTVKSHLRLEGTAELTRAVNCSSTGRVRTPGVMGTPGSTYSMTTVKDIWFASGSLGGVDGAITISSDSFTGDELNIATEDPNVLTVTVTAGPGVSMQYVSGGIRSIRLKNIGGTVVVMDKVKW